MNRLHILVTLIAGLLPQLLLAQDAHFSQFYANPTYMSPAFAGTTMQGRVSMLVRDQWPAIPGSFVSSSLAYDHYLAGMNSGVGLIAVHDRAGSGALRYTSLTAQYAYEIQLKRKVFLRPALQLGYVEHSVDYSRLVFGDQLLRGGDVPTYAQLDGRSIRYADVGAGLLYFTPKLWAGASILHLNQPNQSLLDGFGKVPRKFSMHGGYRHRLASPVISQHAQYLVVAFNYRAQEKYDQLDLGAYFERNPVYFGLWYRGIPVFKAYQQGYMNNDALVALIGFFVKDWRFGYSYDLTISRLATATGGAHEISTVYEFADKRKRRATAKRRSIPCAKF
ncbi:MAG: type IX secretion system membrane protein PorP/SprF [Flavobacteriales bacterium]|nr:type IX secretion system membrane protein PorP/SprF [Flavobacteriales bacterium]